MVGLERHGRLPLQIGERQPRLAEHAMAGPAKKAEELPIDHRVVQRRIAIAYQPQTERGALLAHQPGNFGAGGYVDRQGRPWMLFVKERKRLIEDRRDNVARNRY